MAIQFREGSYAEKIILNIAMTGEYPYESLFLMGGNDRMNKRNVLNLRKESYVTVGGNAPIKTIRLTTKAFPIIKDIDESFLDHYYSMSDNHHFRGAIRPDNRNIWRKHRVAEVYMMMNNLGAKCWKSDKPELLLGEKYSGLDPKDGPYFYDSVEIKNIDDRQLYKVSFTRVAGLLISEGGNYSVYNINKGLIKWNRYGEEKAKVLINDILRANLVGDISKINTDSAVMFAKDIDVAYDVLTSNDKRRDSKGFEILSFDNTFQNIHFLTLDENGVNQLRIISTKDWQNKLKRATFSKDMISSVGRYDADAVTKDGKHILLFFDSNIGRLRRFKQIAFNLGLDKMEVICFPWQEDLVRKYVGDISIKIVEMDVVLSLLELND